MKTLFIFIISFVISSSLFADESRISLTTSEGSGLELRQFEAKVVLDSFLAFTELKLTFYNPEDRRREGRFQIILPNNAAISRFAMKIGEELQEGEVVEKQLAQRAYEDFLHQRQDPALLETDSGNRFNARIFPIEPKAEKVLILSYSQRLDQNQQDYVLPLKGLPKLKQLSIQVFYDTENFNTTTKQIGHFTANVAKRDVITVNEQDYQPLEDFRMVYQAGSKPNLALQHEKLIAARIVPFPSKETKVTQQPINTLVLLIDTSASQAPFLTKTIEKVETLIAQLKPTTLLIYNFDQELHEIGKTVNAHSQVPALQLLKQSMALGASRLDEALTGLAKIKLDEARLVIVSDMVVTAGETDAQQLLEQAKKISWLERTDILIPSYHSDQQLAHLLVKSGKTTGIVTDLELEDQQLANKLTTKTFANIPIKVMGSTWFYPETIDSLQVDEPILIFAELTQDAPFSITVDDHTLPLTIRTTNPILLQREWVRARIDKLLNLEVTTQDKDLKSAFHNEIINLSVKSRVLSPYTSLLVLETEADYQRYQIDRQGLADILTIGADGIEVIKRAGRDVLPPPIPVIVEEPLIDFSEPSLDDRTELEKRDHVTAADSKEEIELKQNEVQAPAPVDMIMDDDEAYDEAEEDALQAPSTPEQVVGATTSSTGGLEPDNLYNIPITELVNANASPASESETTATTGRTEVVEERAQLPSWTGDYAEFRQLLDQGKIKLAGDFAQNWHNNNLSDVMSLIALGEWYEKTGENAQAIRAYGSLIDYFPARADIRRWAAERILANKTHLWLSIDSLEKAVAQRSDHPSGHYLLAIAYWENQQYQQAIDTLQTAIKREFPRFAEANRILTELLGLMLTSLQESHQLEKNLLNNTLSWDKVTQSELRFTLMWETDANDVDFHIYDNAGNHAFYSQPNLVTGGVLYADITTGYGPECFMIPNPSTYPYTLKAHYYSMGPMGYGMGILHILNFVPTKGLTSEFRPFIVMQNDAFVELGEIAK